MKMFITSNDVLIVFRSALIRIGNHLGIRDIEWKSNLELYEEIKSSGTDLIDPLDNFFMIYEKWYRFHYDRRELDNFDEEDQKKLADLIAKRNLARNNLIEILESRGA